VAALVPVQVTPLIIVDAYALFYCGLMLLAGIAIVLLSRSYFDSASFDSGEYYILITTAILGSMVLVSSSHFASFFIGLELLGVSLYVLVAFLGHSVRGRANSLEAGIKYLILSGIASALLLFGIALLYAEFGSLNFNQLAAAWKGTAVQDNLYAAAGLALVLAGISFKLSLVPFHMWTPDVYEGAPAPATAFVATVSKGAIFAVMLRFFVTTDAFEFELVGYGLAVVAIASMLGGNVLALLQNNVKRILAYSSIAHLGYLMVAFLVGTTGRLPVNEISEAVGFYLVAYFVTTLGAFGVVSVLSHMDDSRDLDHIDDYQGLFWRSPWLATVMTAMLLSLAGIPLTVGFIGKFYIFSVGTASLLWTLLAALILGSAIGLFYYLRVIVAMFSHEEDEKLPISIAFSDHLVLGVLAFLLLWLGIYPQPLMDLLQWAVML